MRKISLTGIKPTGAPHIGNYFGMYKPAIALTDTYLGMYFVADLHALTTTPTPQELQTPDIRSGCQLDCPGIRCGKSDFLPSVSYPRNSPVHLAALLRHAQRFDEPRACL